MSINKNGQNVKYVRATKKSRQAVESNQGGPLEARSNVLEPPYPELKPELISWDDGKITENVSESLPKENTLKSKFSPYIMLAIGMLTTGSFFFIGRMSVGDIIKDPLSVSYENIQSNENQTASVANFAKGQVSPTKTKPTPTQKLVPTPNVNGEVIGSKSGKKYYFPWCGTVKRIKPENQVRFANIQSAKDAGYTPGGNCKGIY